MNIRYHSPRNFFCRFFSNKIKRLRLGNDNLQNGKRQIKLPSSLPSRFFAAHYQSPLPSSKGPSLGVTKVNGHMYINPWLLEVVTVMVRGLLLPGRVQSAPLSPTSTKHMWELLGI